MCLPVHSNVDYDKGKTLYYPTVTEQGIVNWPVLTEAGPKRKWQAIFIRWEYGRGTDLFVNVLSFLSSTAVELPRASVAWSLRGKYTTHYEVAQT